MCGDGDCDHETEHAAARVDAQTDCIRLRADARWPTGGRLREAEADAEAEAQKETQKQKHYRLTAHSQIDVPLTLSAETMTPMNRRSLPVVRN